ncbi:MAG: hypothetical protein HEP71_30865 [Roseivirga sp.]|nr:hypothetical protein [Roseivirga sp.]
MAKKDYTGTNRELGQAGQSPASLRYEGQGGTKFTGASRNVITGSSLTFKLLVNNPADRDAFREFSTSSEDEWLAILDYGDSPGSFGQVWKGFLLPEVYTFPHDGFPYEVSITATDGVGRLNGIKFEQTNGQRYSETNSFMFFFYEIMNKLGITREVQDIVNVYCTGMSQNPTDSALMQAKIDPTKYLRNKGRENETVWDCLSVLNDMMLPFLARVRQGSQTQWQIVRVPELALGSTIKRTVTAFDTVDSSTQDGSHLKHCTPANVANPIRFIGRPTVRMDWRWKRVAIQIYPGESGNFILDGDLNPSSWLNVNTLINWTVENRGPNPDYNFSYQRIEVFEDVDYLAGVYIPEDLEESTVYKFTGDNSTDEVTVLSGGAEGPYKVGDKVFLTKADTAVMPAPLINDRTYYVTILNDPNSNKVRLSQTSGGTSLNLATDGSGDLFIGKSETVQLSYAVQINGYQTAYWVGGDITNKNGIESRPVDVIAGSGNSFELAFFWKMIFDNNYQFQTEKADAYYQLIITTNGGTRYFFHKSTGTWSTVATAIKLEDDSKGYGWIRERVEPAEITVDGKLTLLLYQPSSSANMDTLGVQYANIQADFNISGEVDIEFIEKVAEVGADYSEEVEPFELYSGDLPSSVFTGHISVGSNLATGWRRRDIFESKELTDLMLQGLLNNYGRSTITVTGTLHGDIMIDDIISDINLRYNNGEEEITPKLMITGVVWDVKNGTWTGEFKEIRE